MTVLKGRYLAWEIALGALVSPMSVQAQIEVGSWVRQATPSMPGEITMTVEACCSGGRRLTYHVLIEKTERVLSVESRLDGRDAPVLLDGKPSGETMAITRVDARHASAILKMNGTPFGTAKSTLSADGRTMTVVNDYSSAAGGYPVGKYTEIWVRK